MNMTNEEKINEILTLFNIGNYSYKKVHNDKEDYDYDHVYTVTSGSDKYILKKTNKVELAVYNLNLDHFLKPKGSYIDGDDVYLLLPFYEGKSIYDLTRDILIMIIDALCDIQGRYWNASINGLDNFDYYYNRALDRKKYIEEEYLDIYDEFCELYKSIPRTLSNDDLLPFNVMTNNKEVIFIDWGEAGMLPYPLMLARLITTAKEDNYIFQIKEEDRKFAIDYYYEKLISKKGIPYEEYIKVFNYFMFHQYTEGMYVYYKYSDSKTDYTVDEYNRSKEGLSKLTSIICKNR